MNKNDVVELDIVDVTSTGAGVGKHNGEAVFVKGAAIGDRISAVIIKANKNYSVGKLQKIIKPSADRIENDCKAFPRCGGCVYRHISYEKELEIKKNKVQNAFKHIGGIDVEVEEIISDKAERYRNKAQYPVADREIGFYAEHSHRIIDCRDCRLQPEEFEKIVNIFDKFRQENGLSSYDGERGVLRHLYIRKAEATGQIMVCVVVNADRLKNADGLVEMLKCELGDNLKTVLVNINKTDSNVILSDKFERVYGDGYIYDTLCSVKVRLSAQSFYQVNRTMAQKLYEKAKQYAGSGETLIDLYCGAGTIGLSMADRFSKIIGVEIVQSAVEDARFNAKLNNIENAEFYCGDAYETAKKMEGGCDTLIVDPPRKGLSEDLPRLIAEQFKPQRIVYVSCDAATLARDCKRLSELGYEVEGVSAADLFARTSHVETVCLLRRQKAD